MNRVIDFNSGTEKAMFIDGIRRLEGRWRVEWMRYRPRRSDRQNAYYWPCYVEPFADYLGVDPEEAHCILRGRFLKKQVIDQATGERFVFLLSTTALTTETFNEYLEQCGQLLASLGIYVAEPGERRTHAEAPK